MSVPTSVPTPPVSSEWQFLITLSERLRSLSDAVEIQEAAVRVIGEHHHASRVNYAQIDSDEFVIIRSYTAEGVPPFVRRGPVARFGTAVVNACRRGETVVVNDISIDPRFTGAEREQSLADSTAAFVGAPLIKDGRWVAMFGVGSATPRNWTRDQIAVIELTAERTWAARERARAEAALRRQAFLRHLNDTIRPLADPARVLAETCRLLGTHLHVNRVTYGQIDGDDCIIVDDYVDGLPSLAGRVPWRDMGESRVADILKGRTLAVNDTSTEPHTPEERAALQAAGIGADVCPLLVKDGEFVGAFGIHSRTPRVWTPDEIALVQEVADRIWATIEHRKADAELRANEERLAFLLRLNDALRPLSDPAAVQETAARLLREHLGASRVGYAEFEGGEYVIRREHTHRVAPLVGRPPGITLGPALREALRRGDRRCGAVQERAARGCVRRQSRHAACLDRA